MSTTTQTATTLKGGEWLIKESNAFETFTPEDFNEEQIMVRDMCLQFLDTEVLPVIDRIDKLEPGLMPSLMEKAGVEPDDAVVNIAAGIDVFIEQASTRRWAREPAVRKLA